MTKLAVIEGKTVGEAALEEAYQGCRERAAECNGVIILMQKKGGGLVWDAPANMELRDLVFMASGFLHALNKMGHG